MSPRAHVLARASLAVALVTTPVGAEPVRLDITETAVIAYHADNRDPLADNDDYSEWLDRLSLKLTFWRLSAELRLDSAVYFASPTPEYLASQATAPGEQNENCDIPGGESLSSCYDRKLLEYERALLNRYETTIYPSKFSLRYADTSRELTLGDFYAQFGRGLTLAVRKVDEFGYDTTVRGVKADFSLREGKTRLGTTLLAGEANPVRVDEVSGRRLVAPTSWLFPGMPSSDENAEFAPARTETFRPDGIVGVRFEGGSDEVVMGAYASLVARGGLEQIARSDDVSEVAFRGAHPAREAKYIETASASVSLPKVGGTGDFYLEVATQRLDRASTPLGTDAETTGTQNGHALTGSVSVGNERVQGLVEIRHTRRFSPLMANVDVSRANEFFGLQYSAPPTTEPVTNDTEFNLFGYCTTGGRGRIDYKLTDDVVLYGSLGLYRTWSERLGPCDAHGEGLREEDRNDVIDPFAGVVVTYDRKHSRANAWGGARFDDMAMPVRVADGSFGTAYYREGYVRYDALHTIDPTWAVQVQGVHRARSEPLTDPESWVEGENYIAVHWSSSIIAAFGYEYTNRYGEYLDFFNGSLLYRLPKRWFSQDSSARLFAGQQRGALRCVNGICKVFPDFAGARLELVFRF